MLSISPSLAPTPFTPPQCTPSLHGVPASEPWRVPDLWGQSQAGVGGRRGLTTAR